MQISIGYSGSTPLPQTIDAVVSAENAGLFGVWSAEHVGMNDGIVPSTVYAERTKNIQIGITGLNADTRSPGVLAMELSCLSAMAPGRIRIQVGTGSPQRAAQIGVTGVRKLTGVETLVDSLKRLFRGETVSAQSEAFVLDNMRVSNAGPELANIKIDVMAIRPKMTALAARVSDGLSLSVLSSHQYIRSQIKLVEEVLDSAGRDRNDFRVSATVLSSIDPDIEAARAGMARTLAAFPPGLPEMLEGLDVPDADALLEARKTGGPEKAAELYSVETIEGLGLVATPDSLADSLEGYKADGVDELVVMLGKSPESDLNLVRALSTHSANV
ncbi:MAG: LLM class flavin-dependent oxidoreductase [Microbacteriaceae bacterium]|nr:LLM class flavin-dependent oxidoreductase [Microbacteriaceae bacterium]